MRKKGFTLFEILVVMALLAVVAGLVAPQLDMNFGGTSVEAVQKFLRGAVDRCRMQAQLGRTDVVLRFSQDSLSIDGSRGPLRFPPSARFKELVFPSEKESEETRLVFNRQGITSTTIVRVEVESTMYSFLVSPVIQRVDYRKGTARFDDFMN